MRERICVTLGPISTRIGHAHTFSPIFQKNARRTGWHALRLVGWVESSEPTSATYGGFRRRHLPYKTPRPSQTQSVPPIQEPNSQNPKASLEFGSWFFGIQFWVTGSISTS